MLIELGDAEKPLIAPRLVPMFPETWVSPVLVIAPSLVKRSKFASEFKLRV